jgi:hypothetical protein
MNSFDTLIFPDTAIFDETHYPLLLFFSPLHFLQLVESEVSSETNHEAELFLRSGLCEEHIPAPLGDNREHFLRLIGDIRAREEHYVGQLGKLSIDARHSPVANKNDTGNKIVSSLLEEFGIEHTNTETDLKLWQARLVIAIAERLDSNEEDLREELAYFDENEIATLDSQAADDSSVEDLLKKLTDIKGKLGKTPSGSMVKRFEAWLRLMQNHPVPAVKVWLASTRNSAEQIFRRYESTGNGSAVPLLKLAFPAHIMASGNYVVQQIKEFQRATSNIRQGLVADFRRIATTVPYVRDSRESLLPYGTDWADQWEGMLHEYFPASRDGSNHVTIYLLPDQPIARLLSLKESGGTSHDIAAHGLLGILGTPQSK